MSAERALRHEASPARSRTRALAHKRARIPTPSWVGWYYLICAGILSCQSRMRSSARCSLSPFWLQGTRAGQWPRTSCCSTPTRAKETQSERVQNLASGGLTLSTSRTYVLFLARFELFESRRLTLNWFILQGFCDQNNEPGHTQARHGYFGLM